MKITIEHNGQTIEANDHDSLFSQLKAAGLAIKSTCGGCASCGQCVVVIKNGHQNLQEPNFEEKQLLGNVFHITRERLSCQTFLTGDITIDISAHLEKSGPRPMVKRRSAEEKLQVKEAKETERKEYLASKPKKLGGGKKPRAFNFKQDEDDHEENK
jgi:ferredoxin